MKQETKLIAFKPNSDIDRDIRPVDGSIAVQIQALVDAEITIQGCDINDGGPMVLLPADAGEDVIERTFEILEGCDHRTWNITQWRLTLVGVPNVPDKKPPLIVGPNGRGGGLKVLGRGRKQ